MAVQIRNRKRTQGRLNVVQNPSQTSIKNIATSNHRRSHPVEIDATNVHSFFDAYDAIFLDCDGVLWKNDHFTPIPGIPDAVKKLESMGKKLIYVTNNSMHCRSKYADKMAKYGITVTPENMFCVTYAMAIYLKQIKGLTSNVYIIGSEGMEKELTLAGVSSIGVGPDTEPPHKDTKELLTLKLHDNIQSVVVGYDKHFDMNKLYRASSYLSNPKCLFFATDDQDKAVQVGPERRVPIAGALVDAVRSVSGRDPVCIGKPNPIMMDCIRAVHPDIPPERILMVGDNLKTDIAFARNVGIDSALVLTGKHTLEDLKAESGLPKPDYVLSSLALINDSPALLIK